MNLEQKTKLMLKAIRPYDHFPSNITILFGPCALPCQSLPVCTVLRQNTHCDTRLKYRSYAGCAYVENNSIFALFWQSALSIIALADPAASGEVAAVVVCPICLGHRDRSITAGLPNPSRFLSPAGCPDKHNVSVRLVTVQPVRHQPQSHVSNSTRQHVTA